MSTASRDLSGLKSENQPASLHASITDQKALLYLDAIDAGSPDCLLTEDISSSERAKKETSHMRDHSIVIYTDDDSV